MREFEADKIGSATSPLGLEKKVLTAKGISAPRAGDVVLVRALGESVTYGNLELPTGRLARINRGDLLLGVLGRRRALKGFVGDVPETVLEGDRLHLLNMGGVIGICTGHHSSLEDAIEVEVVGAVCDELGLQVNIGDSAIPPADTLNVSAALVFVAGTCMNSGKTVAATELIKQARSAGLRVCGAKLTGVACLRDTLDMQDHGAFATAGFLDCGLPSTVGIDDLAPFAKAILNHLDSFGPDLIVVELGDGIVGGYGVDSVLSDQELTNAVSSFVFCASDYVGLLGGVEVLKAHGIVIDVVAGSVTDSRMGEEFIESNYALKAGNARRDGARLFSLLGLRNKVGSAGGPAPFEFQRHF
jgi:hypothetical protein